MRKFRGLCTIAVVSLLLPGGTAVFAQGVSIYDEAPRPRAAVPYVPQRSVYDQVIQEPLGDWPDEETGDRAVYDQSINGKGGELSPALRRQVVPYMGRDAAGTIVIDTPHTFLDYVLGNGQAIRYGIGVGREGFTWSGVRSIDRKMEWPDWIPPAEMIDRQPDLPRWMAGGPGNPLGARAMYLAGTLYRIHGTNDPSTIGKRVSSGCIRMLNEDVIDLFNRARIGTKVVVLPENGHGMPYNVVGARAAPRGARVNPAPAYAEAPDSYEDMPVPIYAPQPRLY